MRYLLPLIMAVLLVGCAKTRAPVISNQPAPTSSQLKLSSKLTNEKIDSAYQHSKSCTNSLNESQFGKDVAKDVLILTTTQKNRLELIKSKAKLNSSQKKNLIDYLNANIGCRELLLAELKGTPLLTIQEKNNLVLDRVYGALIAREISIGDGNLLIYKFTQSSNGEFDSARIKLGLDQMSQVFAAEDAEKSQEIADRKSGNTSSAGNAALLTTACLLTKNPKACSAGALSGSTDQADGVSSNKNFKFSDDINENIKKQQIIDETKRQMQLDLDYEKRRKELLDFIAKSRNN